jgi:AcrR family transcriptional regulator
MAPKVDRRVQKTRTLLHKALMSIILEKKYESITVQEILDRANVGRSTFYMHYRDKDELLLSGLQNVRSLINAAQTSATAPAERSYEKIIGFSLALFQHVYDYRAVNRALLGSNAETVVRRYIHAALVAAVRQEVASELQKRKARGSSVSPDLLTHFLVSTFISVMTWWLSAKSPVPPGEIDLAYRQLVLPCLCTALA